MHWITKTGRGEIGVQPSRTEAEDFLINHYRSQGVKIDEERLRSALCVKVPHRGWAEIEYCDCEDGKHRFTMASEIAANKTATR